MPLRLHRSAPGAQLRPARRRHRPALFAGKSDRGDQYGQRTADHDRSLPFGRPAMSVTGAFKTALPRFTQVLLGTIAIRCGFLFVAIAAPSLFTTIVKRLIGRARPFVGQLADPFLYQPFAWRPDYASMPSGHATTACAAAVAVGL